MIEPKLEMDLPVLVRGEKYSANVDEQLIVKQHFPNTIGLKLTYIVVFRHSVALSFQTF